MASWADKIPTFNPYVQQLPVEAMVKVGMAKQQQYEEGIQKIQTNIDNIAGLDIMNDTQRKYLQSKLDTLGNNLKTVAAGDFSNFQLVNSVNGMTNQIAKDAKIKNAVKSTAIVKEGYAKRKELESKGLTHKNNDIFYDDLVNKYIKSDDVNASFNSEYTSYTDYQKKWRDIKKDLDIKEDTTPLPFLMDSSGRYIDAKGNLLPPGAKPIPNDYMIKETFKGIDPERLKQAIMSSMDDNDYQQMKIDAYVAYKGYTPDMLAKVAKEKFDNNEQPLLETIKNLNILKSQNSGDQNILDIINKQLDAANNRLTNDKTEFDSSLTDLYNNPEEYKNKIFAMDSINQFANSFSNISHIKDIVSSPIKQQINEDRNYNLQVMKFETDNSHWQKTHDLSVLKEQNQQNWKSFVKSIELYKLGLGPSPTGPISPKYKGAQKTDEEELNGIRESFLQQASITQLQKDQNGLKGQWAKNQPVGTKNLEEKFLSDLIAYRKDPNKKISASDRKIFEQYDELDKLQKIKINAVNSTREEVDRDFADQEKQISANLLKEPGLQRHINGKPTSDIYTAKDIYSINKNISKYIIPSKSFTAEGGQITTQIFDDAAAIRNLTPKEYQIFKEYKNAYNGKGSSFIKNFQKRAVDLHYKVGDSYEKLLEQKNKAFAIKLNSKINTIIPVAQTLPTGSAKNFTALVENKFSREQKGQTEEAPGFVNMKDFNLDTTKTLLFDKSTVPTYIPYGNDVYVTLTGKIDNKPVTQKFKVTKDEFNDSFPGVLSNEGDIDLRTSSSANGSTNYKYPYLKSAEENPKDAFNTAQFKNYNTNKYIVKGDVFFDQNDKNLTIPMIYVKNKKTGNVIGISSSEFNTYGNSQTSIGQITDIVIDNYLKNNHINANF